MVRQGWGSIINTSSIAGLVGRNNLTVYCASKAAVRVLTNAIAMELGPYGVRVNAIAPGMIETPFTSAYLHADADQRRQSIANTVPLRRTGSRRDIAGAVVFLASEAPSCITGSTILIDGGWVAGVETPDDGWTKVGVQADVETFRMVRL